MGRVMFFFAIFIPLFIGFEACGSSYGETLKEGDIVFQDLPCAQSAAIQLATHSLYSHVGMIMLKDGKPFVYEAVGPVKYTSLKEWIKQGDGSHFAARRLKDSAKILTPRILQKMRETAEQFKGKAYDWTFEWSDEKMYCSELVWKIYQRATGLEIGSLQKLKEFDFSRPEVRAQLKEKYGDHVPWNEKVISPAGMFNSDLLVTVLK